MARSQQSRDPQSDGMPPPRDSHDVVAWSQYYWELQGLPGAEALALMSSLGRVHQIMTNEIEGLLKPFGLGLSRYLLLLTLLLTDDGARAMNRLSWHLMVHPTTVTVVVDHMEKDRLVERKPHPTDRRATLVTITPSGRALAREASAALAAANFGLPRLPSDKLQRLLELLTLLRTEAGDVRVDR